MERVTPHLWHPGHKEKKPVGGGWEWKGDSVAPGQSEGMARIHGGSSLRVLEDSVFLICSLDAILIPPPVLTESWGEGCPGFGSRF